MPNYDFIWHLVNRKVNMTKQKQEHPLSFKVSSTLISKIDGECEIESRSQTDMSKILIAEAISYREAKRNMHKLL